MNVNEVISNRCMQLLGGELGSKTPIHPNDDVNKGQSSNDVFPSAVHLAALDEATNTLLPALKGLERSLTRKAKKFENVVKAGRTHLMDAVPVTLGQEFAGYAAQIRVGQERVEAALVHVRQIPLGGTATGTGLNTHPKFAEKVRKQLTKETKLKIDPPADPFEALELGVGARGGALEAAEPVDHRRRDGLAGDGEVVDSLLGLAAVERLLRSHGMEASRRTRSARDPRRRGRRRR